MTKMICLLGFLLTAATAAASVPLNLTVDGVRREGLVFEPSGAASGPAPLVLVFHGHGGGTDGTSKKFRFQEAWPKAVVIYLQGLPTESKLDPDGKKPGWQVDPGQEGNRDLKLTDAVLAWAHQKYSIDDKRVYAAGFSNGAGFSFLLWSQRPNKFAAFGVVANSIRDTYHIQDARPLIHIAGREDHVAKFPNQLRSIETARKINGTSGSERCGEGCTRYTSTRGTPVVVVLHPGAHVVPPWAGARIAEFFKNHPAR